MRTFLEGPVLSIGPLQKVQLEVIYFYLVRKNEKLQVAIPRFLEYIIDPLP